MRDNFEPEGRTTQGGASCPSSTLLTGGAVHLLTEPPADVAYRRAWWSLALYPLAFVAAFAIGEGLLSALTNDQGSPAVWQVLVAATPALLVFVIPGVLAVVEGRKAMRLGRSDGRIPALVGAVIAIAFVGQNILSYIAVLLFD